MLDLRPSAQWSRAHGPRPPAVRVPSARASCRWALIVISPERPKDGSAEGWIEWARQDVPRLRALTEEKAVEQLSGVYAEAFESGADWVLQLLRAIPCPVVISDYIGAESFRYRVKVLLALNHNLPNDWRHHAEIFLRQSNEFIIGALRAEISKHHPSGYKDTHAVHMRIFTQLLADVFSGKFTSVQDP